MLKLPALEGFSGRSINDDIMGLSVSEAIKEASSVAHITTDSGRNMTPAMPVANIMGRNTTQEASVAIVTARPTSDVELMAAVLGSSPNSSWRRIWFSITTSASSTTRPMAMVMASMETRLMV